MEILTKVIDDLFSFLMAFPFKENANSINTNILDNADLIDIRSLIC